MGRWIVTPLWKRTLDRVVFMPARVQFSWGNRKRQAAFEGALEAVMTAHDRAVGANLPELARIYSVGLYTLLLDYDLVAFGEDYLFANDDHRRRLAARQLAVALHGACEDLLVVLGKDYRRTLVQLGLQPQDLDTLGGITKRIAGFRDGNEKTLREIRNFIAAHRIHDGRAQLTILENMDAPAIFGMVNKFYEIFSDLIKWQVALTRYAAFLQVMEAAFTQLSSEEGR